MPCLKNGKNLQLIGLWMDKEAVKQKTSLFSVFFTFAVDNMGATIVFPIFAPLFLDPSKHLMSPDASMAFKTTMLGFYLGLFPLMQFIFAPIMGEYAEPPWEKKSPSFDNVSDLFGIWPQCLWNSSSLPVFNFLRAVNYGSWSGKPFLFASLLFLTSVPALVKKYAIIVTVPRLRDLHLS